LALADRHPGGPSEQALRHLLEMTTEALIRFAAACLEAGADLVVMLCEGGFSLMETDAMNFAILENAVAALRPGGKFLFTCLNGLFPLARSVKDFVNAGPSGVETLDTAFDLTTLRMRSQVDFTDDAGVTCRLETDERHYLPSELMWYMHTLGMRNTSVFGCTAGDFRKCPPTPDHFELMVLAEKAA
jgi:hypothetical protein